MPSAATKPQLVNIVVAEARVFGGVDLVARPTKEVRMRNGGAVELKLVYRLQEAHSDEESYRFEISSKLDGKPIAPAEVRHGDQWGWPEDIQGYVVNRVVPTAGTHTLTWRAEADYFVQPWGGGEETKVHKVIEGTVQIVVE